MCEQTRFYEEYESVDLTEDEQSSEENFADEQSPLNFVDCTSLEEPVSSTSATTSFPSLVPLKKTVSPKCLDQTDRYKSVPIILKNHETNRTTQYHKKIGTGKSCQIKPIESTLAETQNVGTTSKTIETIRIESDLGKPSGVSKLQNALMPQMGASQIIRIESDLGKPNGVPKLQSAPIMQQMGASQTIRIESDLGKPNGVPKLQNAPIMQQMGASQTVYSQQQPGKIVIIKKNNKYYKIVIPHNVMPNINQSTGPVLINIPEVGPLVIRNDPQVTKSNFIPVAKPVSLNLDDVHQSQPNDPTQLIKKPREKPELSAKEAALCNKKFCWTYCRGRKRDLDGFAYNDRLGFTKAECQRAKKCSKILDSIVSKKRNQLVNQMQVYNNFKDSVNERNKVKLIKINEIVGKKKKSRFEPEDNTSPPPLFKNSKRKNLDMDSNVSNSYDSQNTYFTNEVEHDNYDSDLLLTKKVIILNSGDTETVTKKRKPQKKITMKKKRRNLGRNQIKMGHTWAKKCTQKKRIVTDNRSFVLKPCYVQMVRDEHVEEAYRKFYRDMLSNYKQTSKVNSAVYADKVNVRNKGKPKVASEIPNISPTLSPKVRIKKNSNTEKNHKSAAFFKNTEKILNSRIITSEEQFKKDMNCLKPILIVNELNLGIVNYSNQFAKSNIIYIVQDKHFPISILQNENFISAFEVGYVKLVDAQLFCKYITGSGTFNKHEINKYASDHNYCISKIKSM